MFEFVGTKEAFLNKLNQLCHKPSCSDDMCYYFDDYIVERIGEEIRFGIARGGHSGGYWFVPTITNFGDRIEFRGRIRYIGPGSENRGAFKKAIDGIGEFLAIILILPIALVIRGYIFLKRFVRKMLNRPTPKELTNEERLFELMEKYIGCVGK